MQDIFNLNNMSGDAVRAWSKVGRNVTMQISSNVMAYYCVKKTYKTKMCCFECWSEFKTIKKNVFLIWVFLFLFSLIAWWFLSPEFLIILCILVPVCSVFLCRIYYVTLFLCGYPFDVVVLALYCHLVTSTSEVLRIPYVSFILNIHSTFTLTLLPYSGLPEVWQKIRPNNSKRRPSFPF